VSDLAAAMGARMLRLPVGPFTTVVSLGLTTYVLAWGNPGGGSQSVAAGTLYRLGPDGSATPICTQAPPPLRLLARQTVDDARAACPVARRRGSGPEASQEVTWRPLPPGGGAAGEPLASAAVAMIEVPALGARAFALWQRREGGARTWPSEESLAIVPLPPEAAAGIERRVAEGDRSLITLAAPQEESDTPIAEPLTFDVEAPPSARGASGRHLELRLDPDGTLVLVATRRRARTDAEPANESHQIAAYALAATGLPSAPLAWRRICVISWRFEHGPDAAPQAAPRGGSPASRGGGRGAATIPSPPRRSAPGPVAPGPSASGGR